MTRTVGLTIPTIFLRLRPPICSSIGRTSSEAAIGKTIVSSSIIDRVEAKLDRKLVETAVGFTGSSKAGTGGCSDSPCEESAGASFLKRDGPGLMNSIRMAWGDGAARLARILDALAVVASQSVFVTSTPNSACLTTSG